MNVSNSVFYRNLCALSAVQIEFLRTTGITSIFSGKTNRLFKSIDTLPEKDWIEAIQMEYKTVPRAGVTAAEWHQAKKANYNLVRLGALVLVVLVILGLSAYVANQAIQSRRAALSKQELQYIFILRASAIKGALNAKGAQEAERTFLHLHDNNMKALERGDEVLAHEIQSEINRLIARQDGGLQ